MGTLNSRAFVETPPKQKARFYSLGIISFHALELLFKAKNLLLSYSYNRKFQFREQLMKHKCFSIACTNPLGKNAVNYMIISIVLLCRNHGYYRAAGYSRPARGKTAEDQQKRGNYKELIENFITIMELP